MRIAGVRISAPAARTLAERLHAAGLDDTAGRVELAIEARATTEAPLTIADHLAILRALGDGCPASLDRLRHELLEEQRILARRGLS